MTMKEAQYYLHMNKHTMSAEEVENLEALILELETKECTFEEVAEVEPTTRKEYLQAIKRIVKEKKIMDSYYSHYFGGNVKDSSLGKIDKEHMKALYLDVKNNY